MENFLDRLKFLIDSLADGKHTVFAKNAGIPISTFQGYLNGRFPKQNHLLRIREHYNVNIDWLSSGIGEPFLRETFGPPQTLSGQLQPPAKKTAPINKEGDERRWDETSLGKAVDQLRKIYDSGDGTLIRAINANLDAFTRTVDLADEVKSLKNRMAVMESSMKKMEKIIEELGRREECCVHALAESGPPEVDPHK